MKHLFKIALFLFFAGIIISCEKEKIQSHDPVYVPDELEKLLAKMGVDSRNIVNIRESDQKTFSTSGYSPIYETQECDEVEIGGIVGAETKADGSYITKNYNATVCGVQIGGYLDTSRVTIIETLRPNGLIYNCFSYALTDQCDSIENVILYWVGEGESNFSTAQWEIVDIQETYIHFYISFPSRPLYIITVKSPEDRIYVLENRRHQVAGIVDDNSLCLREYVPHIDVLPADFKEIGDILEIWVEFL